MRGGLEGTLERSRVTVAVYEFVEKDNDDGDDVHPIPPALNTARCARLARILSHHHTASTCPKAKVSTANPTPPRACPSPPKPSSPPSPKREENWEGQKPRIGFGEKRFLILTLMCGARKWKWSGRPPWRRRAGGRTGRGVRNS